MGSLRASRGQAFSGPWLGANPSAALTGMLVSNRSLSGRMKTLPRMRTPRLPLMAVLPGLLTVACGDGTGPGEHGDPGVPPIAFEARPTVPGDPFSVLPGSLFSQEVDGTDRAQITSGADDGDPDWSPDGSRLAFTRTVCDTAGACEVGIWVVSADGSSPTQIPAGLGQNSHPDWSPDGSKLVFISNRDGPRDVYAMNADGFNVVRLTNAKAPPFRPVNWDPTWSPDGRQIAFTSSSGGTQDIYVMDADGSNVRQLTSDPAYDVAPSWSPDGTRIAFMSGRDDPNGFVGSVYVMDADGSGATALAPEGGYPSWSPDGSMITFIRGDVGSVIDIFVMNADGSDVRNLTRTPDQHEGPPTWQR